MNISNFIKNNILVKITSANSLLVLLRMIFSLISQKVLAVLVGAEGIAHIGNLKNVTSFLEHFSILGTSNGLVKYISQYKDSSKKLGELFSTTICFAIVACIFSFIGLFFFSSELNHVVFGQNENFQYVFKLLAFIIPFIALNAIISSLLNGLSNYKLYTKINILTVVANTLIIVVFTFNWGLTGSLFAICILPVIHFIFIVVFSKQLKTYINIKTISFSLNFKNQLMSYSLMTIIVVLSINVTDIAIRGLVERRISLEEAGYWTAMKSVSKIYMQFSAAIFPLYILPSYSKITNTLDFRNEVKRIYKTLLPLITIGMFLIFLSRHSIIKLLYTDEFLVMEGLFKWQLMGDFIKFIALVISYQFLAKKQISYFIFTELLSVLLFYVFSIYFIDIYGTEGIVIAHLTRYILYLIVVFYIVRSNFIGKNKTF